MFKLPEPPRQLSCVVRPPKERFYGIETIGKDNSGDWFSMTQRLTLI